MQTYNLELIAGQMIQMAVNADYLSYIAGSGATDESLIKVVSSGDNFVLRPGQSVRLGEVRTDWYISNPGSGVVRAEMVMGVGSMTDNRVQGAVSIVDASSDMILSGIQQMVVLPPMGSQALNKSAQGDTVFLVNPLSSGVRMDVIKIEQYLGDAGSQTALTINANSQLATSVVVPGYGSVHQGGLAFSGLCRSARPTRAGVRFMTAANWFAGSVGGSAGAQVGRMTQVDNRLQLVAVLMPGESLGLTEGAAGVELSFKRVFFNEIQVVPGASWVPNLAEYA